MSKSSRNKETREHYFAQSREYQRVVEAEASFFKGLVNGKDSIPNDPSIQKALRDVTAFLNDSGRPLSVQVSLSVSDPRNGKTGSIVLGTLIRPPEGQGHAEATYFLCLADSESLLCKFHVDFDFHVAADEKKPSPHVQIGGRVSPSLQKVAGKCSWDMNLDKPRMPTLPVCTALLWHWAFLEYQHDALMSAFLGNSWCNNLITDE